VPGAGIEPAQPQGSRDFKSLASTSSATQAFFVLVSILFPAIHVKNFIYSFWTFSQRYANFAKH
jgi:hypothetical protein